MFLHPEISIFSILHKRVPIMLNYAHFRASFFLQYFASKITVYLEALFEAHQEPSVCSFKRGTMPNRKKGTIIIAGLQGTISLIHSCGHYYHGLVLYIHNIYYSFFAWLDQVIQSHSAYIAMHGLDD